MNFSQDTVSYLKNLKQNLCNNNRKKNGKFSEDNFGCLGDNNKKQFKFDVSKFPKSGVKLSHSATNLSENAEKVRPVKKSSLGKFLKSKMNFIRSLSIERRSHTSHESAKYIDKIFEIFNPAVLSELNEIINSPNIETLKYILSYLLLDKNGKETCLQKLLSLKRCQNEKMQEESLSHKKKDFDKINKNDCQLEKPSITSREKCNSDNNSNSLQSDEFYLNNHSEPYNPKELMKKENNCKNWSIDSLDILHESHKTELEEYNDKLSKTFFKKKLKETKFVEPLPDYLLCLQKNSSLKESRINRNNFEHGYFAKNLSLNSDDKQLNSLKIEIPSNEENNKNLIRNNFTYKAKKTLDFEAPTCKINHLENRRSVAVEKFDDEESNKSKTSRQIYSNIQFHENKIHEPMTCITKKPSQISNNFDENSRSQSLMENVKIIQDLITFENARSSSSGNKGDMFSNPFQIINHSNTHPLATYEQQMLNEKEKFELFNSHQHQEFVLTKKKSENNCIEKIFGYESAHSSDTFHSAKTNTDKEIKRSISLSIKKEESIDKIQDSKSRESTNQSASKKSSTFMLHERNSENFFKNNIPYCLGVAKSSEDRFLNYYSNTETSRESNLKINVKQRTDERVNLQQNLTTKECSTDSEQNLCSVRGGPNEKESFEMIENPNSRSESIFEQKMEIKKKLEILRENSNKDCENKFMSNCCRYESSVTSVSSETSVNENNREIQTKFNSLLIPYDVLVADQNLKQNKIEILDSKTSISQGDNKKLTKKSSSMNEASKCIKNDLCCCNHYFCSNIWDNCQKNNLAENISKIGNSLNEGFNLEQNSNKSDMLVKHFKNNVCINDNDEIFMSLITPKGDMSDGSKYSDKNLRTKVFKKSLTLLNFDDELNSEKNCNYNNENVNNNNNQTSSASSMDKIDKLNEASNGDTLQLSKINVALQEIEKHFKEDIASKKRSFKVEQMNKVELTQEKTILERILFQLEWNFGMNEILYQNQNFIALKKRYELIRSILEGLKCKSCGSRYYLFNE